LCWHRCAQICQLAFWTQTPPDPSDHHSSGSSTCAVWHDGQLYETRANKLPSASGQQRLAPLAHGNYHSQNHSHNKDLHDNLQVSRIAATSTEVSCLLICLLLCSHPKIWRCNASTSKPKPETYCRYKSSLAFLWLLPQPLARAAMRASKPSGKKHLATSGTVL
jgi:hypothetical protein